MAIREQKSESTGPTNPTRPDKKYTLGEFARSVETEISEILDLLLASIDSPEKLEFRELGLARLEALHAMALDTALREEN